MKPRDRHGFTLLELLIIVIVSAGMALVVSLFLRLSLSRYGATTEEADLAARVRYAIKRLRAITRHSISGFCNWQGQPASIHDRAFEATETLFFLTDMDQDGNFEIHFIWFDRLKSGALGPATNATGSDRLLHCWTEPASDSTFSSTFSSISLPPDWTDAAPSRSPGFPTLLQYLQVESNFNASSRPIIEKGWEVLFDCTPAEEGGTGALAPPQILIQRRPGTPAASAAVEEDPPVDGRNFPLHLGLAFNVDEWITVRQQTTGSDTWVWDYDTSTNPIRSDLNAANVYRRMPVGNALGAHSVQVYLAPFINMNGPKIGNSVQANENLSWDPGEPSYAVLTTLNLLLVPSLGLSSP